MASDRIFGLVCVLVALAYIVSATQIQSSFLTDPVGPKTFPFMIGTVAALCGLYMMIKPDPEPQWPVLRTLGSLAFAVLVLVAYAFSLVPFGFIIPTAIAAGLLSYQISPRPMPAVLSGLGLSIGLFIVFKFALDLGLVAFPKGWIS